MGQRPKRASRRPGARRRQTSTPISTVASVALAPSATRRKTKTSLAHMSLSQKRARMKHRTTPVARAHTQPYLPPGPNHGRVQPASEALFPELPGVSRGLYETRRRPRTRRLHVPLIHPASGGSKRRTRNLGSASLGATVETKDHFVLDPI